MTTPSDSSSPQPSRWRTFASTLLIALALLAAPAATVSAWARAELTDTDNFVSTFAPLADEPEVQQFVVDQIVTQVEAQVNLDRLVGDLFATATTGLPPAAQGAVRSLQAPAVAGIGSLITSSTERLVRSPAFASLWEWSLRQSHARVIALLDDAPGAAFRLSDDGMITLELEPVIDAVKKELSLRGVPFIDRVNLKATPIEIVGDDSLALTRTIYRMTKFGGAWLPWLVAALFVGGVLAANNRRRAAAIGSFAFAAVFLALNAGIWIGGTMFIDTVSPGHIPADMARLIIDRVSEMMVSTVRALAALGVIVGVAAWFSGSGRIASAIRTVAGAGFTRVRAALDAAGGGTGAVGRFVDARRHVLLGTLVVLGIVALLVFRPVTLSDVGWLAVALVAAAITTEIVRRPATE